MTFMENKIRANNSEPFKIPTLDHSLTSITISINIRALQLNSTYQPLTPNNIDYLIHFESQVFLLSVGLPDTIIVVSCFTIFSN